jgi:type II secretory pathway pseudopilin PulG
MREKPKYRMGTGEKVFLSVMIGMPVLGILSAVAIPAMLNQRARAKTGELSALPSINSQVPLTQDGNGAQVPTSNSTSKGFIELSGSYSVSLKVDGADRGQISPGGKLDLDPGPHEVEIQNTALYFKDTQLITVGAGQGSTIALPLTSAVKVETFPGTGRVYIDEIDSGIESDGSSVTVAHGTHTFWVKSTIGSSGLVKTNVSGPTSLRFPQSTNSSAPVGDVTGVQPQANTRVSPDHVEEILPQPVLTYPSMARIAKVKGTVQVEVTISAAGTPSRAISMNGPEMLRKASEEWQMKRRFKPPVIDGKNQPVQVVMTMNYSLKDGSTITEGWRSESQISQ